MAWDGIRRLSSGQFSGFVREIPGKGRRSVYHKAGHLRPSSIHDFAETLGRIWRSFRNSSIAVWRSTLCAGTGARRATGAPRLVMVMVSPQATSRRSSIRWVLALKIPTVRIGIKPP